MVFRRNKGDEPPENKDSRRTSPSSSGSGDEPKKPTDSSGRRVPPSTPPTDSPNRSNIFSRRSDPEEEKGGVQPAGRNLFARKPTSEEESDSAGRRSLFNRGAKDDAESKKPAGGDSPSRGPFTRTGSGEEEGGRTFGASRTSALSGGAGGDSSSRTPFTRTGSGEEEGGRTFGASRTSALSGGAGGDSPSRSPFSRGSEEESSSGGRTFSGGRPGTSPLSGGTGGDSPSRSPFSRGSEEESSSGGRTFSGGRPGTSPLSGGAGGDSPSRSSFTRTGERREEESSGGRTVGPSRPTTPTADSPSRSPFSRPSGGTEESSGGRPFGPSRPTTPTTDSPSRGSFSRPPGSEGGRSQATSPTTRSPTGPLSSPARTARQDEKKDEKKRGFLPGRRDGQKADDKAKTSKKSREEKPQRGGLLSFGRGKEEEKKAAPKKPDTRATGARAEKKAEKLPSAATVPRNVTQGLSLDRKLDILGGGLIAISFIMIMGWLQSTLSTTSEAGGFTGQVDVLLAQMFGVGRIVLPIALGYVGVWLWARHFGRMFDIDFFRIMGFGLIYSAFLATLQWWVLFFPDFPEYATYPTKEVMQAASIVIWEAGGGGGLIGHILYISLHRLLGDFVFETFLFFWWGFGIFFAFDLSFEKIANEVITRRHTREAQRAVEKVPQPAVVVATAAAGATTSQEVSERRTRRGLLGRTEAPPETVENSQGRRRRAETQGRIEAPSDVTVGQQTTEPKGQRQTPSDSPILAETVDEKQKQPRRGLFGRQSPPSEVPVTAETDGDKPEREKRDGLLGRRAAASIPVDEVALTAPTVESPRRNLEGVEGRRATGESTPSETEISQRRGLLGRRAAPSDSEAMVSPPETASASETSDGQRRGLLGRRTAPSDSEATVSSPETASASETSDGQRRGLPGRRTASSDSETTVSPAETASASETSDGQRRGLLGRRTAPSDSETTASPAETASASETSDGQRRGLLGRRTAPSDSETTASPTTGPVLSVAETPEAQRRSMFGRRTTQPDSETSSPAIETAGMRRNNIAAPSTEEIAEKSTSGRRPEIEMASVSGRKPDGDISSVQEPARRVFGRKPPTEETPSIVAHPAQKVSTDEIKPESIVAQQSTETVPHEVSATIEQATPVIPDTQDTAKLTSVEEKSEERDDLMNRLSRRANPDSTGTAFEARRSSEVSSDDKATVDDLFGRRATPARSPLFGRRPSESETDKKEAELPPVEEKIEQSVDEEKPARPSGIFSQVTDQAVSSEPLFRRRLPDAPPTTLPGRRPSSESTETEEIKPEAPKDDVPTPTPESSEEAKPRGLTSGADEKKPIPVVEEKKAEDNGKPAEKPVADARWTVPDFHELLAKGSSQDIDQQYLLERARLIEETLESFGAPGRVVEVNTGPVITQFGVEPDFLEKRGGGRSRVKVSAIAGLDRDLALALAAKSIRIEAPVPGKGYVGIEVPNAESELVSLRDVMESQQHQKLREKSSLTIGLGKRVDGGSISADLTQMPHLLIAGATGSGKSVCVNAIIGCLLLQNTPDDLQFIMVDPKRVELTGYNGIPHLVAPVVVDLERIVGVLKWVQREMDDRYKRFAALGARNILDYNQKLASGEAKLPYLVVLVDELADLMMLAPEETERLIARLAQMARATGIHLIISTQRPSVDVVTGLIKANFPARIAFAVASSVDSRVILDQPGAEKLLGRGDMLYQAPDAPAPLRMQGVYASDPELNSITHYWKSTQALARGKRTSGLASKQLPGETPELPRVMSRSERINNSPTPPPPARPTPTFTRQSDFWQQVKEAEEADRDDDDADADEGVDDLYDEAVELVRQRQKASISMLQRHFRIGYTRSARLIDLMEERGVVGPAESGAKPRSVLLSPSDDDE